jgi:hypothetical protein
VLHKRLKKFLRRPIQSVVNLTAQEKNLQPRKAMTSTINFLKQPINIVLLLAAAFPLSVVLCGLTSLSKPKTEAMTVEVLTACSDSNTCSKKIILLSGRIFSNEAQSTIQSLEITLTENPDIRDICLNSIGGDNDAAVAISLFIAQKKLNTCLANRYQNIDGTTHPLSFVSCQSSCTWVMLAGKERTIFSSDVFIGFHGSKSWVGIGKCHCTFNDESAKTGWQKLIVNLSNANEISPEALDAQLKLLDWSFDQGYGRTVPRKLDLLLTKDYYFTQDSRAI